METVRTKYQDLLIHEFEVRSNRNASYSLRAYARDLGISVSSLSRILNGQQDLSLKNVEKVVKTLGLSPSEANYFYALVKAENARTDKNRAEILSKLDSEMSGVELSLEYFKTISDWHYFAILELTGIKGFKSDSSWIANRLGISPEIVEASISRLLKLELLEEVKGSLRKTYDFKATPSGIPSRAIKTHHQQIMKKAETALFELDIKETDFSSVAFTMNSEDLKWATDEMKKFRRALTKRLAKNKNKDRLYELSMQLFPLDQRSQKKESSYEK